MKLKKIQNGFAYNHWNIPPLDAYIYEDVLDANFFNLIKKNISNILEKSTKDTFLTHNTIFNINGQTKKIVSHKQNDREQNVIYDLTFDNEWYYQTVDTVKDWAWKKLYSSISPIFLSFYKKIENLEPINKDYLIPLRLHLNYLPYEKHLGLHVDCNPMFLKRDGTRCEIYSFTFYLHDHIENCGGEIWSPNGFVHKPKENSCIIFNGNQILHGVTENKNPSKIAREAFTIRFVSIHDLFLPGHPDKHLYKQDHL
jgi:hypothetical protein